MNDDTQFAASEAQCRRAAHKIIARPDTDTGTERI